MSAVLINQIGGKFVARVDTNTTYQMANLIAANTENVSAASITKIWYSTNSSIEVLRGANSKLTLWSTGILDLKGNGWSLNEDTSANIVIVCPANSVCIFEASKVSNVSLTTQGTIP